jgi:hypothetical protein
MTEPTQPEPSEQEQQTAAHWYMIMKDAHEIGLLAQRRLEEMNALPGDKKLFQTRKERRLPGLPSDPE